MGPTFSSAKVLHLCKTMLLSASKWDRVAFNIGEVLPRAECPPFVVHSCDWPPFIAASCLTAMF